MRNSRSIFNLLFVSAFFAFFMACDKEAFCEGRGTLTVFNSSAHTPHLVFINGAVRDTLYPGDSRDIELAVGTYSVRFGALGSQEVHSIEVCGMDFVSSRINIYECETERRNSND